MNVFSSHKSKTPIIWAEQYAPVGECFGSPRWLDHRDTISPNYKVTLLRVFKSARTDNHSSIFLWVGESLLGNENTIEEFTLILVSDVANLRDLST